MKAMRSMRFSRYPSSSFFKMSPSVGRRSLITTILPNNTNHHILPIHHSPHKKRIHHIQTSAVDLISKLEPQLNPLAKVEAELESLLDELKKLGTEISDCGEEIKAAVVNVVNTTGDMQIFFMKNVEALQQKDAALRQKGAALRQKEKILLEDRSVLLRSQVATKMLGMAEDIHVPSSRRFSRLVSNCQNFVQPDVVDGCHRENLVSVHHTLEMTFRAVETVVAQNSIGDSGALRCSPIVYPRLARGGKSTFLRLLFDKLKEDPRFAPIILTFNGSFCRRSNESARQAIVRSIACQLADIRVFDRTSVVCDENTLLQYIDESREGKAVVLLIDELNMLGAPLDDDASTFLKQNFLDPINRALVFTSHVVVDLDYFIKGFSPRGLYVVPMPFCKDMKQLKQMAPHCATLTPLQAVIYGYIPSMIYSFLNPSSYISLESVFNDAAFNLVEVSEDDRQLALGAFVQQCLGGTVIQQDDNCRKQWLGIVRHFDRFGSVLAKTKIQFPIGYIAHILDSLQLIKHVKITDWFRQLLTYSASVHSGKDWEIIIQFAVLLRCADVCMNGYKALSSPVHFFDTRDLISAGKIVLRSEVIPDDFQSVKAARKWFLGQGAVYTVPTLLIATPCDSKYPAYDMFIALYSPLKKAPQVVALQCKAGESYPDRKKMHVPDWIEKAFLIQGREPADLDKQSCAPKKWVYLSAAQVEDFLGYSLAPLYPGTSWNKKRE